MWAQPVPAHAKKPYKKGLQEGVLTHVPFSLLWVWLRTFSNAFSIGAVNGPPRCLVPSFSAALVPGYLGLKKKSATQKSAIPAPENPNVFIPSAQGWWCPQPSSSTCSLRIFSAKQLLSNYLSFPLKDGKLSEILLSGKKDKLSRHQAERGLLKRSWKITRAGLRGPDPQLLPGARRSLLSRSFPR